MTAGTGAGTDSGAPKPLAHSVSAWCLAATYLLATVDVLTSIAALRYAALLPLLVYFALGWPRLLTVTRVLLVLSALLAAYALAKGTVAKDFNDAVGRMVYFPAFIASLGLLRSGAMTSPAIDTAGRFLISQPPSWRYAALTLGGHAFAVLFNLGGFALLLDMIKRTNTLEAANGDATVRDWRERRMATAVTRGIAAICFWSPIGVALNFVIASIPGLSWSDVLPIGAVATISYLGLGWLLDYVQRPRLQRPAARPERPVAGGWALAAIAGQICGLSFSTVLLEIAAGISFQAALLLVVPFYGMLWATGNAMSRKSPAPIKAGVRAVLVSGINRFPGLINEAAIFSASGFLGTIAVALTPRGFLIDVIGLVSAVPALTAPFMALIVAGLGFLGITPLITVAVVTSAVAAVPIPGLPSLTFALAILAGWAITAVAGPMNTNIIMMSSILGRSPWQVSVGWNGVFALTALTISLVLLGVFGL